MKKVDDKIDEAVKKAFKPYQEHLRNEIKFVVDLLSRNNWLPPSFDIVIVSDDEWELFNSSDNNYDVYFGINKCYNEDVWCLHAIRKDKKTGEKFYRTITGTHWITGLEIKIEKRKVIEKFLEEQKESRTQNFINIIKWKRDECV